ncbi:hypothetical protein DL89DRAFT_263747 [Linderina pennispora]|uniref:SPX-domain-containing protein n=1 Tax=Linderina pennispora TaxID=61395 RepID=A0A1Y1WJK9_9FUNG|nr:uncharacterized protein DL89DRAFT_263747 [Linderina pennispora]ORX73729.1 hypothetical protein DL89DRAFT_263747 [Linderina pennispora]
MKFGKTIETSAKELPEDWQPYIIQYKLLKKNIKRIVNELDDTFRLLNLDASAISDDAILLDSESVHSGAASIMSQETTDQADSALSGPVSAADTAGKIEYLIEKDEDGVVHPVITVKLRSHPVSPPIDPIVELNDDGSAPLDELSLPPTTPTLAQQISLPEAAIVPPTSNTPHVAGNVVQIETKQDGNVTETQVTVRLQTDQAFFDQLIDYIERTRAFEKDYTHQYNTNVQTLGVDLTAVTSPFKHDFEIWREIFRLYMDADIWSHTEGDFRPTNSAHEGQERFTAFTRHIEKLGLPRKFRDKLSGKLLVSFYKLNTELIYMKLLQEMNEAATRKIIKKHDKRTHLVAKTQFPQFVAIDTTTLTKALIFTIHNDLVGIVPQIDDYLCPMCLNVAWRPLRLECNHVFCSRCVVKASRRRMFNCPVCRAKGAIYRAGVDNVDQALLNFLKLYFPKEIKEKQADIQQEISEEEVGIITAAQSRHKPCIIM